MIIAKSKIDPKVYKILISINYNCRVMSYYDHNPIILDDNYGSIHIYAYIHTYIHGYTIYLGVSIGVGVDILV